MSQREADIAIGLAPPEEGRLHARKLGDYDLGLYASRDYLAREGVPSDRTELKNRRFIGYVSDLIYAPELDYVPLVARDLEPSITSSNLLAQYNMTLAGYGICVLPCFMASGDDRLQRLFAGSVTITRAFWLIVHTDMRDLARIRVTADFIADQMHAERHLFSLWPRPRPTDQAGLTSLHRWGRVMMGDVRSRRPAIAVPIVHLRIKGILLSGIATAVVESVGGGQGGLRDAAG